MNRNKGKRKANARKFDRDDQKFPNRGEARKDEGRDVPRGADRGSLNDISWYTHNPSLVLAAASLPYPYRPGMPINFGLMREPGATGNEAIPALAGIPGVLRIDWSPSIGQSHNITSPASIIAREIYGKVRAAYSGQLSVDAPDFVIYLLALDSVFSYIGFLKRLYRALHSWSSQNYSLPNMLVAELCDLTPSDADRQITLMRADINKLWQGINELVFQSRKFTCPAIMDVFNRHYWLNDNVYTDADSLNSQFFVFRQKYYYRFELVDTPESVKAGGLVYKAAPSLRTTNQPVQTLLEYGTALLEALSGWGDAYTISGYLSRAYEGVPSFAVAELLQGEVLTPAYVPEVLMQIENLSTVQPGPYFSAINATISQDVLNNVILSDPTIVTSKSWPDLQYTPWTADRYLSIRSDAPTVADNLIASRMHSFISGVDQTDKTVLLHIESGTEICLSMSLICANPANDILQTGDPYDRYEMTTESVVTSAALSLGQGVPYMMQFDWHPLLRIFQPYKNASTNQQVWIVRFFGDIHNITNVPKSVMENIHRVCILSEFNAYS